MGKLDVFRLIFLFVLVLVFAVSGMFLRRAGRVGSSVDRKAEGTVIRLMRPVLGLPFLFGVLAHLFFPGLLEWSYLPLPQPLRWVFAAAALLCIPLMFAVFKQLGSNATTTIVPREYARLVTTGLYRVVRHPLYALSLAIVGCLAALSGSVYLLACFLVALPVFRCVVIPREEKKLLAVFGEDYRSYRRSTGALFPRLFR